MSTAGDGGLTLQDDLIKVAKAHGRYFTPDARPEAGGFFRSDHFSFAKQGLPAISFKGGQDLINGGVAAGRAASEAYTRDRYHQPAPEMLDTVYRALHDPERAGLIPVAVSPVNSQVRTRRGPGLRSMTALVFDWDGVHYVYRPYHGTVGHPIPLNPVTGLPYLCVKDGGLIESIYFSATYLKSHPAEKAVVVTSDDPAAAYTVNGKQYLVVAVSGGSYSGEYIAYALPSADN